MPIRCLAYVEYDQTGSNWLAGKIRDPAWDDIVTAVRRLA